MDAKFRARVDELRKENPGLPSYKLHAMVLKERGVSVGVPKDLREPGCDDGRDCEPVAIGELLPGVVEQAKKTPAEVFNPEGGNENFPFGQGPRAKGQARPKHGPAKRGRPRVRKDRPATNSEQLNRALVELSPITFKIYMLLWKWRGAPAKGILPFFTIHSLGRFCRTGRHEVKRAIAELTLKGWLDPEQYDKHHKNSLYRLVPIAKVPPPGPAATG